MKIVESKHPPISANPIPLPLHHFCNIFPSAFLQHPPARSSAIFPPPSLPPPHTHTFTPTSSISSPLIAQNHYSGGEELQKSVKMKTLKSRHGDARISQCTTWRLVNVKVCSTFPSKRIGKLYVDKSSYVCFVIK